MKTKIILSVISIVLMSFIGAFTVFKVSDIKSANVNKVNTENVFILKSNNGNLAVFSENFDLLCEYDFNIYSLPDKDVEILTKGLRIQGFNNLRSAIEDYTS